MPENNYKIKMNIISKLLKDIANRRNKHYKKYVKLNKISNVSSAIINCLNGVSICSLILTFSPALPVVGIIALASSSISGILTAGFTSYDLNRKISDHQTAYLEYSDLYREMEAKIKKNNLSSEDLDQLLEEINDKLSLIETSAPPIKL
jgi:hypothetical protein